MAGEPHQSGRCVSPGSHLKPARSVPREEAVDSYQKPQPVWQTRFSVLSQFPSRSTGVRRRSLADRSGTPEFQIQSLPLVTFSAKLGFSCAYDGCV